jgi:bifunctional non-homologous end joining protein LigD
VARAKRMRKLHATDVGAKDLPVAVSLSLWHARRTARNAAPCIRFVISISMAARVLYPATGFTTVDLAEYYTEMAALLRPHLVDRPLSLKRYPDDIEGEAFWEKDAPNFTPKWVKRYAVPRRHEHSLLHYIGLPDKKSLRWAASIGCIELHPFLHRYPYISSPTSVVFDLDPGHGITATECCAVALQVRAWFASYGLESMAKFSGSKGIQVYVPLNTPTSYAVTQPLARAVAEELARRHPDRIVATMDRAQRRGRVFIDWSQNADYKTTVSVYSVRAKTSEPFVSVPLTWEDVKATSRSHRYIRSLFLTPSEALARVRELGDIFAPVFTLRQILPRELEQRLHLPRTVPLQPVQIPRAEPPRSELPRSSGQGGRKLFVIHERDGSYEFGLEYEAAFFLFEMPSIPVRTSQKIVATATGTRPLSYLTDEGEASGVVWDLGTYELVEGNLAKGRAEIYLSGRRLSGAWLLELNPPRCAIRNESVRLQGRLAAHSSVLHAARATGGRHHGALRRAS